MFPSRSASKVLEFLRLIDALAEACAGLELHEIASHCIEDTGLYEFHGSEKGERGVARKENLDELVSACRQFNGEMVFPLQPGQGETDGGSEAEPVSILQEFLDQVALDAGDREAETGPAVQMMTLHSAKGLEFPLVFLAGMEENLFPHRMSAEEPGRIEEERRLCYVGITRAMQELYLTYAETRRLHGNDSYNRPSRFIREIPSELLQEVRLGSSVQRPYDAPRGAKVLPQACFRRTMRRCASVRLFAMPSLVKALCFSARAPAIARGWR